MNDIFTVRRDCDVKKLEKLAQKQRRITASATK